MFLNTQTTKRLTTELILAFTQCRLLCTRKTPYMYPIRDNMSSGGPTLILSGWRGQAPVKA